MELLVTTVAMATTIGLRDPLWRDPGLTLYNFYLPAGPGNRHQTFIFGGAAQARFSKTTMARRRAFVK